jgi:hypothetical protein
MVMDSLPSYIDLLHFSIIDKTFTGPFRSTWVQPRFLMGSCYSIFSFICMFCRSLFVLLYFLFWPLCCLFFFDIRILINPLVSSNSSWPRFFCGVRVAHLINNMLCIIVFLVFDLCPVCRAPVLPVSLYSFL